MRRSSLLLVGTLSCLVGIAVAAIGWQVSVWPSLALLVVVWLARQHWLRACLIVLAGLGLGVWRGDWYADKLSAYSLLWHKQANLVVQAADDATYGKHSQLSFTANHLRTLDGQTLTGTMVVSGFGVNSIVQDDVLLVSGKITPGLGAEQARVSFAKLKLLEHHPSLVADARRKFSAGVMSSLPEPEASFVMGLLIGQRVGLPDSVKQDLLMVGLTHIIAVSGYNLTIILQAARRLLSKHSKRLSLLLSLSLIGAFLLLAGNSASIVRAAIVSLLSIFAAYYGRRFSPLLLLSLAATITAWARPAYIWHDASWALSFLAFYGVLVVAPSLSSKLPERWREAVFVNVAIESISAELMSLPFILHNFGQMSLVGLPANILVTVFVPLAMLLGLISGLAGWLVAPLAGWLAWPARWLLTYMLQMAHWLASLPHIFLQNLAFPTTQMAACYGLIVVWSLALWHKTNSLKYGTLTDEEKEPI